MKLIKHLDHRNYNPNWKKYKRNAVRAIIFVGENLAMIHSQKFCEYKFPGGGIEKGETHTDTLIRETKEETGLIIIPSTIREYGMTIETRKGIGEEVFEQNSYYYLCSVQSNKATDTMLDEYEAEYGYHFELISLDKAIKANEKARIKLEAIWIAREVAMLRHLKNNYYNK